MNEYILTVDGKIEKKNSMYLSLKYKKKYTNIKQDFYGIGFFYDMLLFSYKDFTIVMMSCFFFHRKGQMYEVALMMSWGYKISGCDVGG